MGQYYDGCKLLNKLDINGDRPEIFMCCGNRTGGKTTYFNRLLVNHFINNGTKFMLLYRFKYELDNIAEVFFKDIRSLFFKNYEMTSEIGDKGNYYTLKLNEKECGYATCLNSSDRIKKLSHLFSDVDEILFDEFQSETNHYCAKEIEKFRSIHTSIARGQGKHVRYVPVYMVSNSVSLLNPYFVAMGISTRIRRNTNFLRGPGYVLEQAYVEAAAQAISESSFNMAFGNGIYSEYMVQNVYMDDNKSFIEKPNGKGRYLCTIKFNGKLYSLKEFQKDGIIYCDDKPDMSNPNKLSLTTQDHQINYVMLANNRVMIDLYRYYFEHGCFRFKNIECKNMVLNMLAYQ